MAAERSSQQFYVVIPAQASDFDTEYFKSEPIHRGDPPKCSRCGRFLGMRRWISPRRAQVVVHGQVPGDFAFASNSDFLLSDIVVDSLRVEGISGLSNVEEVEVSSILGAESSRIPRYFFADVTQQGAGLDLTRSDIKRTTPPTCVKCLSDGIVSIQGFVIDNGSWTGDDIFIPRGLPGVVVVSESFRSVAEHEQFGNIEFVPTEEYRWAP